MSERADEWVTQREAAALLGNLHPSVIPKMLRRGDLTSRRERPSLRRADVLRLRDARADQARLKAMSRTARQPRLDPQPPDDHPDWMLARELAAHLGVGVTAVHQRARRGRLPYVTGDDGTRWFRRDLVAMAVRAQDATRTKKLANALWPDPAPGSLKGAVVSQSVGTP